MAMARGSAISGVIAALFVGGTLVYAIAAQMTEPPLEPASTFIDWQALWSGGTLRREGHVPRHVDLPALHAPRAFHGGDLGGQGDRGGANAAGDAGVAAYRVGAHARAGPSGDRGSADDVWWGVRRGVPVRAGAVGAGRVPRDHRPDGVALFSATRSAAAARCGDAGGRGGRADPGARSHAWTIAAACGAFPPARRREALRNWAKRRGDSSRRTRRSRCAAARSGAGCSSCVAAPDSRGDTGSPRENVGQPFSMAQQVFLRSPIGEGG